MLNDRLENLSLPGKSLWRMSERPRWTPLRESILQTIKNVPFLQSPWTYRVSSSKGLLKNRTVAQPNSFQTSIMQKKQKYCFIGVRYSFPCFGIFFCVLSWDSMTVSCCLVCLYDSIVNYREPLLGRFIDFQKWNTFSTVWRMEVLAAVFIFVISTYAWDPSVTGRRVRGARREGFP